MQSSPLPLPAASIAFAALWVPPMLAASYAWRHGQYYDYGWFVPPAAALLFLKRWKADEGTAAAPSLPVILIPAGVLLPVFFVLRTLGHADPSWRLPMILLAATAAIAGHLLLAAMLGWRKSRGFFLVTALLLSAVPWPMGIEKKIIGALTGWVTSGVTEIFHLSGKPVEISGDRLQLHGTTVEVTDGCSGVRSFQSFLMASWFFSGLQDLRWMQTLLLLASACGMAFAVNLARTYTLAHIRFAHGEQAFDRAHDAAGWLAFGASAMLFYFISGKLSEPSSRKVMRTHRTA